MNAGAGAVLRRRRRSTPCALPSLGRAWLLAEGRRDVGYALACWRHSVHDDGRVEMLGNFLIKPGMRGRGLGARLLRAPVADMSGAGARAVFVEDDSADAPTTSFYARWPSRRRALRCSYGRCPAVLRSPAPSRERAVGADGAARVYERRVRHAAHRGEVGVPQASGLDPASSARQRGLGRRRWM
jgi:GNAT superfamily N-acetyltransferase